MKIRKSIGRIGVAMVGVAVGIIAVAAIATPASKGIDDTGTGEIMTASLPDRVTDTNTNPDYITLVYREPAGASGAAIEMPEIETPKQEDIEMLAKLIWGEARGVKSTTEQAAVVWCVLNRVDATGYACGGSIEHVVTFPNQFQGYSEDYPATEEYKTLAEDVLTRWYAEKAGYKEVGRILPPRLSMVCRRWEKEHLQKRVQRRRRMGLEPRITIQELKEAGA